MSQTPRPRPLVTLPEALAILRAQRPRPSIDAQTGPVKVPLLLPIRKKRRRRRRR